MLLLILFSACAVNKASTTSHPFVGGQVGCGNFTIYKLSEDNTELISISLKANGLDLRESQAYSVEKSAIEVKRKKYANAIDASLCNDIMSEMPKLVSELIATDGLVEVRVTKENLEKYNANDAYRVTLIIKDLVFPDSKIDYLQIENVVVGWMPG